MFKYTFRYRAQEIDVLLRDLEARRDDLRAKYAELAAGNRDPELQIGRIFRRPRSIVIEIGPGSSLNLVTKALWRVFPDRNLKLPQWS